MLLSAKTRSYSSASSASASSASSAGSAGSRADDLYDRLRVKATVDVWSAGNVRVNGRDQSLPTGEAQELMAALRADDRFETLAVTEFDGDDCKASYRLTSPTPPTPPAQ